MPIIRKRLTPDELSSPTVRINPDTGEVESFVGGEWIDNPALDPRINTLLPPKTGENAKCNTAASQVRFIAQWVEDSAGGITTGTNILSIAALLIGRFYAPFFPLVLLATAIVNAITVQGVAVVTAAFTLAVYDQLLCIFFCASDDNGFFDEARFNSLYDAIDAEIGGVAAIILHAILPVIGYGGLNMQGAAGLDTDDCSECDCGCPHSTTITMTHTAVTLFGDGHSDDGWVQLSRNTYPTDDMYLDRIETFGFDNGFEVETPRCVYQIDTVGNANVGVSQVLRLMLDGEIVIEFDATVPNVTRSNTGGWLCDQILWAQQGGVSNGQVYFITVDIYWHEGE